MSQKKRSDRKKQKLSVKFTLMCILPAALVLSILCFVSVMITNKGVIVNMQKTLTAQGDVKCKVLEDAVTDSINSSVLPKKAAEITAALKESDNDKVVRILDKIKIENSIISDVSLVLTDQNITIGKNGSGGLNSTAYWYDKEKISNGDPYFAVTSIVQDQSQPLLTYVYPFSLSQKSIDSCLVLNYDSRTLLKMLELTVAIKDSKWLIVSDDNTILYHSLGYNEKAFSDMASFLNTHNECTIINNTSGEKQIIHFSNIEKIDNLRLMYIVPSQTLIQTSRLNVIIVVVVTVISIIMLAFFILLMTKKIVGEINSIKHSLKGIVNRDYTERIDIQTRDEIGELAEDFNYVIEELRYQAEHDSKTDFFNSATFPKKVRRYMMMEPGKTYSVVRVDIDNFSFVNDIFDWDVGDQILVKIASVLKSVFAGDAVHGYLGNDVFVVFVGYDDRDDLFTRVIRASDAIKACDDRINLVPHFGVVEDVSADADITVMCDYAGVALKTIKGNLFEVYAIYDEKFNEKHKIHKYVESNKQKALDNKEFFLLLQPKYDIDTGKIIGAESLVRWRDPDTGEVISPGRFIPIFEKNGFIVNLDKYVWEETCKIIRDWREKGYYDIPVSVNVSRIHITHPNFTQKLEDLVRKYNIPPRLLEIEITESALIGESEAFLETVMNDLKSRGFNLLMDDFASGYSSLLALQKMPFDVIKIDKALIDNIDVPKNEKFVAGTVSFLFDLEKDIVVEGVEYNWQRDILKKTGIKKVQGYCYSRPIPVSEFEKLAFSEQDEVKPDSD